MEQSKQKIQEARRYLKELGKVLQTGEWDCFATDNAHIRQEIGQPQRLRENLQQYREINTAKALKKFTATIRPERKFLSLYKYAALLICVIGLSIFFHMYEKTVPEESLISFSSAYLVTGNNTILSLDKKLTLEQNGMHIVNTDSGKIYFHPVSHPTTVTTHKLVVPRGTQYTLQLSDGTKVHLNSGSEISFPSDFSDSLRIVTLSGEACFEVTPSAIPFVVKSTVMEVRVLGTTFNLMVYPEEPNSSTTLISGKVRVACPANDTTRSQTLVLVPGMQADFDKTARQLTSREMDVSEGIAWLKGELSMEEADLGKIMRTIGRNFNVDFHFQNPELADVRCFISIQKDKGLDEILKILHLATQIHFENREGIIEIYK